MLKASYRKLWFLVAMVFIGFLYALPNYYGEVPAIELKTVEALSENELSALGQDLQQVLQTANITAEWQTERDGLRFTFASTENQLHARDLLQQQANLYTVALNLAPNTPKWLRAIGAAPMKLGLDLRGGVHFLLEVSLVDALQKRQDSLVSEIKTSLRDAKIRYNQVTNLPDGIVVRVTDADQSDAARVYLKRQFGDFNILARELPTEWMVQWTEEKKKEARDYLIEQTLTTLRNRVNELGVSEAIVQRQGLNRIAVELPGIQDISRAKDLIGKTATLSFLMRDDAHSLEDAVAGKVPAGSRLYYFKNASPVLLKKQEILSGDSILSASIGSDRDGLPAVSIRVGGEKLGFFKKVTKDNIGKQMAVVYIESKVDNVVVDGVTTQQLKTMEHVISLATIQSALGNSFQITGLSMDEASNLAIMLRSGAMPAQVNIVQEQTVGPSLGQENIRMGLISVLVGMGLVLGFTWFYYGTFGLIADAALMLNVMFLLAILSVIGATLTLPGMAAIVLTVGMAVDANVLIFERIREELRLNNTPHGSIVAGFDRAWATILDSNLTTLIVGMILFGIGSGPIRGFAVNLCIGILTSMFTAVTVTKSMIEIGYAGRKLTRVPVGI